MYIIIKELNISTGGLCLMCHRWQKTIQTSSFTFFNVCVLSSSGWLNTLKVHCLTKVYHILLLISSYKLAYIIWKQVRWLPKLTYCLLFPLTSVWKCWFSLSIINVMISICSDVMQTTSYFEKLNGSHIHCKLHKFNVLQK